jgi:DNA-binding CsgD family transcriptional regulator
MMQPLRLGPSPRFQALNTVPPRLQPLIAAANRGDDVAPILHAIAQGFGFDGFMYGVSLSPRPNAENQQYVYLTWPLELLRIYSDQDLIEVDPRVQDILESVIPQLWDQKTYRGRSPRIDALLDLFSSYDLRSGIVVPIRDTHGRVAMLSLSSSFAINDEVRTAMITQVKGDITLFGLYFHELFVSGVLNDVIRPSLHGAKLSPRERECIDMSAHGLSGEDISQRLCISPRTVQHHFDSIRGKLNATSRQEAVAIAVQMGIIQLPIAVR